MRTSPDGTRVSTAASATAARTRPGMPANSWTRCSAATRSTSPSDSAEACATSVMADKRNPPGFAQPSSLLRRAWPTHFDDARCVIDSANAHLRGVEAIVTVLRSSRSIDRYIPDDVRVILEERFWQTVEQTSTLEALYGDGTIASAPAT